MLPKTTRPWRTAAAMVAKESSFRITSAASRATWLPRRPMAIPTSAFFRAGASLTPSPGHGHHAARLLVEGDEVDLLLGVHAGENANAEQAPALLLAPGPARQVAAAHGGGLLALGEEADLPGDRPRRGRLVPRHHHDPDPGGAAGGHGLAHLRPGRVLEQSEADPGEPLVGLLLARVHRLLRQAQHAVPLARETLLRARARRGGAPRRASAPLPVSGLASRPRAPPPAPP